MFDSMTDYISNFFKIYQLISFSEYSPKLYKGSLADGLTIGVGLVETLGILFFFSDSFEMTYFFSELTLLGVGLLEAVFLDSTDIFLLTSSCLVLEEGFGGSDWTNGIT